MRSTARGLRLDDQGRFSTKIDETAGVRLRPVATRGFTTCHNPKKEFDYSMIHSIEYSIESIVRVCSSEAEIK